MSSVAMFDAEDTMTFSFMEKTINSYIDLGIKDNYNMSLSEYLELPFPFANYLNDVTKKVISRKEKALKELQDRMKDKPEGK